MNSTSVCFTVKCCKVWDGASGGVPADAFTDGAITMADNQFKFDSYNIKAQKQAGLHLTSDDNRAKEVCKIKKININCVTSSKLDWFHFFMTLIIL